MLREGRYRIAVPEEGALLVIARLVELGRAPDARAILRSIEPWFDKLRFYPVFSDKPYSVLRSNGGSLFRDGGRRDSDAANG